MQLKISRTTKKLVWRCLEDALNFGVPPAQCCHEFALLLLRVHVCTYYVYSVQFGKMIYILPVVPHKAVAEVSNIGNYRRDWLL